MKRNKERICELEDRTIEIADMKSRKKTDYRKEKRSVGLEQKI